MQKSFDAKNAVRVIVRVRPVLAHERESPTAVRVLGDRKTLHAVVNRVGDKETIRKFDFDCVCGPDVTQGAFFESSGVRALLDAALGGVNVSVFAYGQTGSGKTFTMSGAEEKITEGATAAAATAGGGDTVGIIPRAVQYLFQRIAAESAGAGSGGGSGGGVLISTSVRAACCEIYNEGVYDLLNLTGDNLPLRYTASQGHFVQGQVVVGCDGAGDVSAILAEAHRNRSVSSHALNMDSSRSHSLFTLYLERSVTDEDTGETLHTRSKVLFVDLAGSERLKDSKSSGDTAGETAQINRSLFTLGKVIAALSERKAGGTAAASGGSDLHIPYRDSKLTRLLQDSLGGSALTVMVNCVTPSALYLDETLNTLQYALRASRIENAPVVQVETKESQLLLLKKELKWVRTENERLRAHCGLPAAGDLDEQLAALGPLVPASELAAVRAQLEKATAAVDANASFSSGGPGYGLSPGSGSVGNRSRNRARSGSTRRVPPLDAATLSSQTGAGGAGGGGGRRSLSVGSEGSTGRGDHFSAAAALAGPTGKVPSRIAERAAERSGKQLVLDAQQAEIESLTRDKEGLSRKLDAAKARIAALARDMEDQRAYIERLNRELEAARKSQREAERSHHALLTATMPGVLRRLSIDGSGAVGPGTSGSGGGGGGGLQEGPLPAETLAALSALEEEVQMLRESNSLLEMRVATVHPTGSAGGGSGSGSGTGSGGYAGAQGMGEGVPDTPDSVMMAAHSGGGGYGYPHQHQQLQYGGHGGHGGGGIPPRKSSGGTYPPQQQQYQQQHQQHLYSGHGPISAGSGAGSGSGGGSAAHLPPLQVRSPDASFQHRQQQQHQHQLYHNNNNNSSFSSVSSGSTSGSHTASHAYAQQQQHFSGHGGSGSGSGGSGIPLPRAGGGSRSAGPRPRLHSPTAVMTPGAPTGVTGAFAAPLSPSQQQQQQQRTGHISYG